MQSSTLARMRWLGLGVALALAACESTPSDPRSGSTVEWEFSGLRALDPATEGSYEAWAYGPGGDPVSLGRFTLPAEGRVSFKLPVSARRFVLTVEPPGDANASPSPQTLLAGEVRSGRATLTIQDVVTHLLPLNREPGHHSLFTSSNNVRLGYPSFENAGLWMFSIDKSKNAHGTREVKMTPLRPGWIYEGWVVHRYGTPGAVWISYGKFRPDETQLLNSRDDTGSGPFSGDEDYRNGGIEDVPGEEWTTNPLDLPIPGGLPLPFELDAVDPATGEAVWTHVITIEPAFDEDEPLLSERPFLLRPYRNPIGAGGPGMPRKIVFQDNLPTAVVQVLR